MRSLVLIDLTVFLVLIFLVLSISGCGDSGVSNGAIRGTVYANRSGGSVAKTPEPGVTVLAVYQDEPKIIRTAISNASGQFTLPNLAVGKWALGYQKDGFQTIKATEKSDTTSGSTSALGDENKAIYVETDTTISAPDVTMNQKPPEGDGTILINLIDAITGERINGATVAVGTSATSNGSNGQYVLVVAVANSNNAGGQASTDFPVTVAAEGYDSPAGASTVGVLPGQTVEKTIRMVPIQGTLEGRISMSRYENLYDLAQFRVSVDGLATNAGGSAGGAGGAGGAAGGAISANGDFSISVPVRTSGNNRSYTLRVSGKGVFEQVVNNILAPLAGAVRVEVPPLIPETVTVIGTVNNPVPSNPAVIDGAGLEGGVTGGVPSCLIFTNGIRGTQGSYSIDGVPTNTKTPLTVKVTTYKCKDDGTQDTSLGSDSATFTAINNGTGVYRVASGGGSGS